MWLIKFEWPSGRDYQKDYQENKSWTPRYIKFVSRALSGAEINYGSEAI